MDAICFTPIVRLFTSIVKCETEKRQTCEDRQSTYKYKADKHIADKEQTDRRHKAEADSKR